jgi:polysaccharide export outer membrane protein
LKIRTMVDGADKHAANARSVRSNDPQVTKVGRILRDLKLDELPQLWNVIRGEMALVGPRPIAITLQKELEAHIPEFCHRLTVKPGLTSLAQVCVLESDHQDRVIEDWSRRFEMERHYLGRRSAFYDVIILGLTILYILRKVGRRISLRDSAQVRAAAMVTLIPIVAACTPALDLKNFVSDGDVLKQEVTRVGAGQHPATTSFEPVQASSLERDATDPHYRIGTGDRLHINVFGEPGMENISVRVDADGLIQLPVAELVTVAGLTTMDVQQDLKQIFSEHFKDPWVVASLAEYRSRPVYMLGEFNKPGVVYLEGPTDIVEALGLADGMTDQAYLRGARLLRGNQVVPVDINALFRDGRADQNLWLSAGDTVYVPGRRDLKVFVIGAVSLAGPVPMKDAGLSLIEALSQARGPVNGRARLDQVRIIRTHSPVRGELIVVDAGSILAGKNPDFALMSGDIVFVPQNVFADWNDIIDAIAPTVQLVGATLQPFVQVKFLSDS